MQTGGGRSKSGQCGGIRQGKTKTPITFAWSLITHSQMAQRRERAGGTGVT